MFEAAIPEKLFHKGELIMKSFTRNDLITHPRQFSTYRWYKPILVALIMALFTIISVVAIELITKTVFGAAVASTGYDDMDFFTAAGAFSDGAQAAASIPCLLLAALIVKDRPVSSFSPLRADGDGRSSSKHWQPAL